MSLKFLYPGLLAALLSFPCSTILAQEAADIDSIDKCASQIIEPARFVIVEASFHKNAQPLDNMALFIQTMFHGAWVYSGAVTDIWELWEQHQTTAYKNGSLILCLGEGERNLLDVRFSDELTLFRLERPVLKRRFHIIRPADACQAEPYFEDHVYTENDKEKIRQLAAIELRCGDSHYKKTFLQANIWTEWSWYNDSHRAPVASGDLKSRILEKIEQYIEDSGDVITADTLNDRGSIAERDLYLIILQEHLQYIAETGGLIVFGMQEDAERKLYLGNFWKYDSITDFGMQTIKARHVTMKDR